MWWLNLGSIHFTLLHALVSRIVLLVYLIFYQSICTLYFTSPCLTHRTFISLYYPLYHRCTLGVALVYVLFYQSVLDPRGIHLYIILSPRCVSWLICFKGIDSFMCVTWLVHVCGMTRSSVRDRSISTLSSHLDVWYDSFLWGTWLVHVWETDACLHYSPT